MEKPVTSFRSIPAEIRLRVLRNTHLGPPNTGGYNLSFGCLRIQDGKRILRHNPMLEPPRESVCSSPSTHRTSAPQCQCRVLPTQLYLVDKQMRREAVDVFYSTAYFDFYGDNLGSTLSLLRDVIPREGLSRLRRLKFIMSEAQCEGWAGGAVVAFLAEYADLPRLTITVDMDEGAWEFVEDTLIWDDSPDLSMFRFIYDFHNDVATAMCSLKGLGGVKLKLGTFRQLRPWREREVLGYEQKKRILQSTLARRREQDLWQRPRCYQRVPCWHDMNRG